MGILEEVVDNARRYLPIGTVLVIGRFGSNSIPAQTPTRGLIFFSLNFCLVCHLLEQIFSRLKSVKTKLRTDLDNSTLHNLLEICIEGPSLDQCDVNSAIDLWW